MLLLPYSEFIVYKEDGTERGFKESARGLYYLDINTKQTNNIKEASNDAIILINTVEDNKTRYTECDYSKAVIAHPLQ